MKIDKNTSWKDWYAAAAEKDPCQADFAKLRKWEGQTLGEIFDSLLTREDQLLWELSSTWALKFLDSSPELRLAFLNHIMDVLTAISLV